MTNAQTFIHHLESIDRDNTLSDTDIHIISKLYGATGHEYVDNNTCTIQFKDNTKAQWEWFDYGFGNIQLKLRLLNGK